MFVTVLYPLICDSFRSPDNQSVTTRTLLTRHRPQSANLGEVLAAFCLKQRQLFNLLSHILKNG